MWKTVIIIFHWTLAIKKPEVLFFFHWYPSSKKKFQSILFLFNYELNFHLTYFFEIMIFRLSWKFPIAAFNICFVTRKPIQFSASGHENINTLHHILLFDITQKTLPFTSDYRLMTLSSSHNAIVGSLQTVLFSSSNFLYSVYLPHRVLLDFPFVISLASCHF